MYYHVALASEIRLAIFPFTVRAEDNLSYIQEGMLSMLPPRITSPGEIAVLDTALVINALQEKQANDVLSEKIEIGKMIETDYILIGSVTKVGDNFSVDTSVMAINSQQDDPPVYSMSMDLDTMIEKVNRLAEIIKGRILEDLQIQDQESSGVNRLEQKKSE
jgi:hypothetical protein